MKVNHLDTTLAEFTYTVARESPVSLRRFLPERIFKAISTEKGAMRFAMKSTLEEKKLFFTCLGIEHFTVFVDTNKNGTDFVRTMNKFKIEDKQSTTLQRMAESNVYVSGSKEHAYLLGFLAQSVDSNAYVLNMQLMRASYHIKNFRNKFSIPEYAESKEAKETGHEVSKIISSVLSTSDNCELFLGIDRNYFRVLLHFYINRQSYLTNENLTTAFGGILSGRMITMARKKLYLTGHISHHPSKSNPSFTITTKGIMAVNQFRERVIKSLDF